MVSRCQITSDWYETKPDLHVWGGGENPEELNDCLPGCRAAPIAAFAATPWSLRINGVVGFQLLDDGTPLSLGATLLSAGAIFIGTGYIALDTAFRWTHYFDPSLQPPNRNYGLYVLYLLVPLICLVIFFVLETVLVLRILGEKKPMRTPSHHPESGLHLTQC